MTIVASELSRDKPDPKKHRGAQEDVLYGDYYCCEESAKERMEKGTRTMKAKANLFRALVVLSVVVVAAAVALFGVGLRTAETQTTTPKMQVRDLGTLGGASSYATGINNSGKVVGYSDTSAGEQHAFIYDSTNGMKDLNDLLPADSSWTITSASAINSDGKIAATGHKDGVGTHALLLTPTSDSPPPSDTQAPSPPTITSPKTTPTTQTAPLASLAAPKPLAPWSSLRALPPRVLSRLTPPLERGAYLSAVSQKALTPTLPRPRMLLATPLLPPIP